MVASGLELALFGAAFLVGVVLVIWCVEVFIEAVAQSAVSLGISGFFLAVILAGIDLENAALGVTAAVVALPDLALGTVFGESLFVLAVALGLAGVFVPFEMDVPRAYLAMLLLVPLPAFAMSLGGTIDAAYGAALLAAFVPLLGYIFWRERRSETTYLLSGEVEEAIDVDDDLEADAKPSAAEPTGDDAVATNGDGSRTDHESTADGDDERGESVLESDSNRDLDLDLDLDEFVPDLEDRSGRVTLGVAVLATVGMTLGSFITVGSAERLFVAFGISGLAFGATVLSFIASIEELALTLEPVRQGRPHLAVGNVVGSTVFYMTANVGLIALLHPVDTGGAVMTVHWPFFGACLLVATAMLARSRVTRAGGVLLLALYAGYWVFNYAA
ncbi:sodium:calcium antiporter [Halopiger xanaduensis]|uniref:Sodium/calcium exchanger membrane region n=1 Tax=Halopiger xanaduensis (strain DSM 18323 / JCM 14033 / SH-6) TaxID=797210 RepID=F8D791_HALXS|nr:sodium/hydrogen exchanger [Halopiger xanaduensis]AEH36658.1 sodium/calcium exchanger membrane region [Halopiger xanaduensis SH-6]